MTNKSQINLLKNGYLIICSLLLFLSLPVKAEWNIVTHTDIDSNQQTKVAHSENSDDYSLEIYRDGNNAIRARFSMHNNLNRLNEKSCPTHQVDKRNPENTSINEASCIAHRKWAEFVLGYIAGNEVTSTFLHNIMNGSKITFRFKLENSGYTETAFSLIGSKRALIDALGFNLIVLTDTGFSN